MKKSLFVVAAVIASLSFSSCAKDYTCTCTTTISGSSTSVSTTVHGTKSKAKTACEAGNSSYITCAIK